MNDARRRVLGFGLVAAVLAGTAPLIALAADLDVVAQSRPYVFVEKDLSIAVGDTVTWMMADGDPHTVTSGTYNASGVHPDGLFDSGALTPGQTFAFTFTTAGVYPYVCSIHADSGMVGRITVGASPSGDPSPAQSPSTPTASTTAPGSPAATASGSGDGGIPGSPADGSDAGLTGPLVVGVLVVAVVGAVFVARLVRRPGRAPGD